MVAIAVRLALAASWLTAGVAIALGYLDMPLPWLSAWVAFLMCAYNLLKAWMLNRNHKHRAAPREAKQRPYREGEAPPVRRTP